MKIYDDYRHSLLKDITSLYKKTNSKIWLNVKSNLLKTNSNRPEVNVEKIAKFTKNNDIVIVPGKVLGDGDISHIVKIGALNFSDSSISKITSCGGEALLIPKFIEKYGDKGGIKLIEG